MDAPHYVLAGGGTGGHLFPGIAVANALVRRQPEARITFLTTGRPLDGELLTRTPFSRVPQRVRPFSTRPWHWPAFLAAWQHSVRFAGSFLREQRVRAVLGLGGYAAGPAVAAARAARIPAAILNPDAVPGRANRYLARRCDLVCLQWQASREHFPPRANCQVWGCPIRAEFAAPQPAVADARRHFGLEPQRPVVLVTGASQGAATINAAVLQGWPDFARSHPDWQLVLLAGGANADATRAAYAQAGIAAQVLGFTHEMPLLLSAVDVVVSRAGASTLAELATLGRAAILLPYPYHRDRHQHANAQVLVDAGAALLLEDHRDARMDGPLLAEALGELAHPQRRSAMEAASRRLGQPNAADTVADWLISRT